MAASAADVLTAEIIQRFKDDAAMDIFVQRRVFDFVPRDTAYPYITVHITDSDEWDTSTDIGEEHTVFVHVWDDKEGSKRVNEIMQRALEMLHGVTNFSITDHTLVNLRRVSKRVEREGQLYHGMERFRAVTEEII